MAEVQVQEDRKLSALVTALITRTLACLGSSVIFLIHLTASFSSGVASDFEESVNQASREA